MMKLGLLLIVGMLLFSGCTVSNISINTDFNMLALKNSQGTAIGDEQKPRLSGVKPIYQQGSKMKKLIVALVAVFMMAGCLDVSSDGNGSGNDYSHDNDNSDQSIHDSNVSGSHGNGADDFDR